MLDTAAFLMASYAAMSAGMSATIAKVSPSIGPKLRHLFAGAAPLGVLLAYRLEGGPSTVLTFSDLLGAGGLVVMGIATSSLVGKYIPTQSRQTSRLPSE